MVSQVTMNNTMCLGLFLLVVHSRGLNWDFTSEVIVTVGELKYSSRVGSHGCAVATMPGSWLSGLEQHPCGLKAQPC